MDADRWYQLGQEALEQEKYHEAKDLLQNVIQLDDKFVNAYHDLALVHIHQGNFDEALQQYEALTELDSSIPTRIKHAGILLFLDRIEDAQEIFLRVLEDEEKNMDALKGLGDTFFRQNNFKRCQEIYDQLLELNPDDAFIWYSKAEAYYRAQDHETSFDAIEKAIELEQKPEFFAFKGDFFIRHDNYERALEQYTLAANLSPHDTEVRLRQGFILRILDRQRDAIEAFDKVLDVDPYSTEALENKIEILQSQGKQEAALGVMEQLVRLHPEDLKSGLELAHYYMDNQGYERAAQIFELLIDPHYDNAEVWYGLAYSLLQVKEYERAHQAVIKAKEYDDEPEQYDELQREIDQNLNS